MPSAEPWKRPGADPGLPSLVQMSRIFGAIEGDPGVSLGCSRALPRAWEGREICSKALRMALPVPLVPSDQV